MSNGNYPNSLNDVISTVTHVLLAFEDLVRYEIPECYVVYDEELSYETAIRGMMAKGNFDETDRPEIPLFAYNRTSLRKSQLGIGGRADNYEAPFKLPDGRTLTYVPLNGEFEINFMFITKSMEVAEKFEVTYLSDTGISGTKNIQVDMDTLGVFNYYVNYGELTDKQFQKDDVYYKAILGTVVVRGFFFTFSSEAKVIHEIRERIYALRSDGLKIKKATFTQDVDNIEKELLAEKLIQGTEE